MEKRKQPVRLYKKEEKSLFEDGLIAGIPKEFLIAICIVVIVFLLIICLVGPTESGNWYNHLNATV